MLSVLSPADRPLCSRLSAAGMEDRVTVLSSLLPKEHHRPALNVPWLRRLVWVLLW